MGEAFTDGTQYGQNDLDPIVLTIDPSFYPLRM